MYGLIVWFLATLFVVYSFCLNTAAAVFSTAIKTSLDAGSMGVSIATGSFIVGFACMQIPAGYLLDKFNARYIVSLGILILACGNFIISFSGNLLVFSLSNVLQGIGASFSFIAAAILISQWFPARMFPVLFGLTQTLSCILAGVVHYYLIIALKTHTWNDIYQMLAIFGVSLFVLSILFVKSPANFIREPGISLLHSLQIVLKNKQILLCSIAAAMSFGVLLAYASFWYMPVQSFFGVQELQSAIISGFIFFGIGVGTPLLGWVSNLVKSRKMIIHITVVLGAMMLLAGLYLPHFEVGSLFIIKTVSFLIGFFLSGSMLFYTIVSEMSSDSTRGVALSVLNTTVFLFNTLLMFIPYMLITEFSKHYFTYLWVLPFFVMFSILLLYFVKDTTPDTSK